jgi:hypothetical protein
MFSAAAAVAVLALASSVVAQPSPFTPSTTKEGDKCLITWEADPTGEWTETNIQLMTGDNFKMIHLTTVTTVDTTDEAATSFEWPCPKVEPNSVIYFYQYSVASAPKNLTWSTRFAISDEEGKTVPPEFATQPDANKTAIPWGVGALEDPSTATPPPAYITGQTVSTGTPSTSANGTSSTASGSATQSGSSTRMTTVTGSPPRTSSTAAAAPTATANSALTKLQGSALAAVVGTIVAGVLALI